MVDFTSDPQYEAWQRMVGRVRAEPGTPFDDQWQLFAELSAQRPAELGPMPAWWPSPERIARSNLAALMAELDIDDYHQLHRWSVEHRDRFWAMTLDRLGIRFESPPDAPIDPAGGPEQPRWLPGGGLNIVDSCFQPSDCMIAVAVVREGSSTVHTVTYGELETLVNRVANGLHDHGFRPGEGIALYMPMTLECVAAYLGAIRAGCYVVSIADSFSAEEVARRLRIGAASGVITVDHFDRGGTKIALYDKVVEAGSPRAVVIRSDADVELRAGDPGEEVVGSALQLTRRHHVVEEELKDGLRQLASRIQMAQSWSPKILPPCAPRRTSPPSPNPLCYGAGLNMIGYSILDKTWSVVCG